MIYILFQKLKCYLILDNQTPQFTPPSSTSNWMFYNIIKNIANIFVSINLYQCIGVNHTYFLGLKYITYCMYYLLWICGEFEKTSGTIANYSQLLSSIAYYRQLLSSIANYCLLYPTIANYCPLLPTIAFY